MKKFIKPIIYILVTIFIIIILSIITIKQYEHDNKEPELTEFGETTFEFTGDSNHYAFNTGKVFFNENAFESKYNKKIVISDFEQIAYIEGLTSEKLTIYFDNKVWKKVSRKMNKKKKNTDEVITNEDIIAEYSFEEEDLRDKENNKKKNDSPFLNVTKYSFVEDLRIEMEYCTKEEGCITEVFKINYNKGV